MIDPDVVKKLREKFSGVHPQIFYRSVERAESPGDLFDILESIPKVLPIIWSEELHRWVTTSDLTQASKFEMGKRP